MADIESLYKKENGRIVIEIVLSSVVPALQLVRSCAIP